MFTTKQLHRYADVLWWGLTTARKSPYKKNDIIAIRYNRPAVELAEKIGLEINADGYIKQDGKHRTTIPGVYSAGDVEGGYKQIVTASGQGAEAAMTIFEDLINPYWLDGKN